jgi:hypothetical protein
MQMGTHSLFNYLYSTLDTRIMSTRSTDIDFHSEHIQLCLELSYRTLPVGHDELRDEPLL